MTGKPSSRLRQPPPDRSMAAPAPGPTGLAVNTLRSAGLWSASGAGSTGFDPTPALLPEASGPRDAVTVLRAHGCWYPSPNPDGTQVAFISDRGGVPQLWAASVDRDDARLLDSSAEPVTEVSWSPDGRWIAYTITPGGGEHGRVLCVRPDGTGRRVLAGGDQGSSAYLGCWTHDGSAVTVTVAAPAVRPTTAPAPSDSVATSPRAHLADRGGRAT
ncbi:TolB family protein, partial [Streptomyces sp. YS-3]